MDRSTAEKMGSIRQHNRTLHYLRPDEMSARTEPF